MHLFKEETWTNKKGFSCHGKPFLYRKLREPGGGKGVAAGRCFFIPALQFCLHLRRYPIFHTR